MEKRKWKDKLGVIRNVRIAEKKHILFKLDGKTQKLKRYIGIQKGIITNVKNAEKKCIKELTN
jgi:hypothetical protein